MQKRAIKITVAVIIALAVAAAAFAAGFFTHKLTRSSAVNSYEWALGQIEKYYYFGGVEDGFTETAMDAIVAKYLDSYSAYYTAEEYDALYASNAGSKSGLGLTYSFVSGRGVFVHSVIGNSPAYDSGLRDGEWLVSATNAEGEEVSFSTSADFANVITSAGDGEDITFISAGGKKYTMAKAEYTASYTYMCTNSTAWIFSDAADGGLAIYEKPSEAISYLPDGAAYIRISQFYGTAHSEFLKLIEKFNASGCTSLILDLRSNGGGYVSVMQYIAGAFAGGSSQAAMVARYKDGTEEVYNCYAVSNPSQRVSPDVDVYVLANSGTASASEALIGAMICYGALEYENVFLSDYTSEYISWLEETGQEVKTARTYGKGIMQSPFENPVTGDVIKLTTAQIYWPDGETCIHGVGLTAERCTPVSADWVRTLPDYELQSVLDIISSR